MSHTLYLLAVWLHIVAAAVWIGGMVFLALVIVPLTRQPEYRPGAAALIQATGVRFRRVGWVCLLLLVLSGIANLVHRGFGWHDVWSGHLFAGIFGHTLAMKLALVFLILLISVVHDFFIGPRATALGQTATDSPKAMRLRRQASWVGRLNLLLALGVVALGVLLVRG